MERRESATKKTRSLMRNILPDEDVRSVSRRIQKLMGSTFGELLDHYGLSLEDSIRFQPLATRLREAREGRGIELKAAAKALRIPQYRLRHIEDCHIEQLRSSDLHAYVDFLGLDKWFARWRKAIPKLSTRLASDPKSKGK